LFSRVHEHEQASYLVRGRVLAQIGDEERELRAGDGSLAGSNVIHAVTALEESVGIDIFSPPRTEYLDP
jgi:quercetin dioxygenase-like cupin family protein